MTSQNAQSSHPGVHRFSFADLELDTVTREVTRGGEALRLTRLTYDLLLALVRASPQALSHEALVATVWRGRVVGPETITQRVHLLRAALDDDAQTPRYVAMVRGEGYRLLPDVVEIPIAAQTPRSSRSRFLAYALGALAVLVLIAVVGVQRLDWLGERGIVEPAVPIAGNTLAVLPFANATGNADYDYISAGLGDEIREQLGLVPSLRVVARPSSLAVAEESLSAREIAGRLGAKWLLKGRLQVRDERLSLQLSLIDGDSGDPQWSRNFERSADDLLALRQDVAAEVVSTIMPNAQAVSLPQTNDPSAHALMLLARHLEMGIRDAQVVDVDGMQRVIELYRRAGAADPKSALAQSRLAGALLFVGDVRGAEEPMQRALTLDPDLSEVQYTLGAYHWARNDGAGGAAYERAIELNPNNADALAALGMWRWQNARVEEAGDLFRRSLQADPMSVQRYLDLGTYYAMNNQPENARQVAARLERIFNNPAAYMALGHLYETLGDLDVAIAWVATVHATHPDLNDARWYLAELYARIGDDETARRIDPEPSIAQLFWSRRYQELADLAEEQLFDTPEDIKVYYILSFAYSALGRYADAIRILDLVGIPEVIQSDSRRASAVEASIHYAGALSQIGETDRARAGAEWLDDFMTRTERTSTGPNWWVNLYYGCVLAVLGDDERAIGHLEEIPHVTGLVWAPVLKDAACFHRYREDPRYRAVVAAVDQQIADLYARVSAQRERYGH